jgi:hypothetical protein
VRVEIPPAREMLRIGNDHKTSTDAPWQSPACKPKYRGIETICQSTFSFSSTYSLNTADLTGRHHKNVSSTVTLAEGQSQ